MTVLMLCFLVYKGLTKSRVYYKLPRNFISGYALFIVLYGGALLLNGEYSEFGFTKLFLANFLNCIVTYFAIDFFISDTKELKRTIYFLLCIAGFNSLISIFQFIGHPLGNMVTLFFTTSSDVQDYISTDGGVDATRLFGEGVVGGLFSYPHTNAVVLSCFGILSLGLLSHMRGLIKSSVLLVLLVLCLYACFATQERAAFYLFVLFSFYLFIKCFNNKKAIRGVIVLFVIIVVISFEHFFTADSLGRLAMKSSGEDVRASIWSDCLSFLSNNLLLGGPIAFSRINELGAHNFFFNAFINCGLLGGLVAVVLYFYMLRKAVKIVFKRHNEIVLALGCSVLIYSLVCLFHNASIVSGDTLIFIIFPLMMKSLIIEERVSVLTVG